MPRLKLPRDRWSAALTPKQMVVMLLVGAVGFLLLLWTYDKDPKSLRPTNPQAPPGALRLVVLMGMLSALAFVSGVFRRRSATGSSAVTPAGRDKLRRPPRSFGWSLLMWQLALGALLFCYASPAQWTYQSVGFDAEWPVLISLAAGLTAYVIFAVFLTLVIRLAGKYESISDHSMQVHAGIWPRQRGQKALAIVAICLLNPNLEELAFRGVLVHQFADAIGTRTLPIVLGLFVTLGNHSYQGLRGWWTHVPFYAIVVGLLYSPAGLWGAVGFHFGGDAAPIVTLRVALRGYRKRHRRAPQMAHL